MATIYDRRGGVLFDPTDKDNGVYTFEENLITVML